MGSDTKGKYSRYVYWLDDEELIQAKLALTEEEMKVGSVLMTPCEVMRASKSKALVAAPKVWSFLCKRQGSWYRNSDKFGKHMLVSAKKLPESCDKYLDVEITESDFKPESLPSDAQLQEMVDSTSYQENKPEDWEKKSIKDAVMFKTLFTLTGFWGWGESLKSYWLSHKANHANYLCHAHTTNIDGESVPYSVAENAGICSSCVEFFNLVDESSRKLVRACPGAVTFGFVKRKIFYDINPNSGIKA